MVSAVQPDQVDQAGNLVGEALLHAPLVGGASILQAKRHGYIAVRTIWGIERGCKLIRLLHRDLVIA